MKVVIFRLIFSLVGALLAGFTLNNSPFIDTLTGNSNQPVVRFAWVLAACFIGALLFYLVYPEISKQMRKLQKLINKLTRRLVLLDMVILIFALVMSIVLYNFFNPILIYFFQNNQHLYRFVNVLMTPSLFLIVWMIGVAKKDIIVKRMRGFIGIGESNGRSYSRFIIDSSALIDGRIVELIETGILKGKFAIPSFVMVDLQKISDSPDPLLAHRGKRGSKSIEGLQELLSKDLDILPSPSKGRHTDLLMKFLSDGSSVISCDRDISDEIRAEGGNVININEVSSALKTIITPGEEVEINVIKEGKDKDQGIGFLSDGTMVVVENGHQAIGTTVKITCTSLLQNPQGRIVFGRIK
jgi:uncharacterized protein YacL